MSLNAGHGFDVHMTSRETLATEKGIDAVEFLISPNPGETPKPLAKIVSGGELSRVMLALKSILTSKPTRRHWSSMKSTQG